MSDEAVAIIERALVALRRSQGRRALQRRAGGEAGTGAPVAEAELIGLAPRAAFEGFPEDVPLRVASLAETVRRLEKELATSELYSDGKRFREIVTDLKPSDRGVTPASA